MANGIQYFPFDNSAARLRYFLGQILTQRDLQIEQGYHVMLQRLLQREVFGTGTSVGLEVRSQSLSGGTASESVFVEPGLAFDPDGRELLLEREVPIDVADPLVAPSTDPGFGTVSTLAELAAAVSTRFLGAAGGFDEAELLLLQADLDSAGLPAPSVADLQLLLEQIPTPETAEIPVVRPPELLREWLFDQLVGVTYVGIAYREVATDLAPASLDAACCGDRPCFPSRTQEGVTLVASRTPLPSLRDPYLDFKLVIDQQLLAEINAAGGPPAQVDVKAALCAALVRGGGGAPFRGAPAVGVSCADIAFPAVPLARVNWRRFAAAAAQMLAVDNCSVRPLAPGVPALRALLESLSSSSTPALLAPRVVTIAPADGAQVLQSTTLPDPPDDTPRLALVARVNSLVRFEPAGNLDDLHVWEIVYYPASGTDPIQRFVPSGASGAADGPAGTKVRVSLETVPDSGANAVQLVFSGGTDPFPVGTYVWRLLNGATNSAGQATSAILNLSTNVQLDGEPSPQGAVPSGDGRPGGAFEARFFIAV